VAFVRPVETVDMGESTACPSEVGEAERSDVLEDAVEEGEEVFEREMAARRRDLRAIVIQLRLLSVIVELNFSKLKKLRFVKKGGGQKGVECRPVFISLDISLRCCRWRVSMLHQKVFQGRKRS